jgi:uncharacterized protein YecT (DUF1311 family)
MSWSGKIFLLTFFIFATGTAARAQCGEAKTTLQINECFAKELKKADARLNRVYQQTREKLSPQDAALLQKAQRAWVAFRDAQCEAEHALLDGGTAGPAALMSCKLELTRRRVAEIKTIYQSQ